MIDTSENLEELAEKLNLKVSRCKVCGNSMGVNCMRWIGLGIQAVEDEIKGE